ncbi:ATP-binding protein, partial [Methanospirillum hungatei]|uniref:ATP-binding protein n=1 Tax=Methanospirillum hungatei TaxID=2203 RepID=UPI0026F0CE83
VFVQIFSDRIEISSPGGLPPGMQQTDLGHKSVRRNPIIADLYHRIGFIEKAGTGIERMREGARESGCPEPVFDTDGFFTVTFTPNETPDRHQDGTKIALRREKMDLLKICQKESTLVEILSFFGRSDRSKFRKNILLPLVEDGLIELTIPDRPTSKHQKYRITPAG